MIDERIDRIRSLVQEVPDFPKPGILFRDITPVLGDPAAFAGVVSLMGAPFEQAGVDAVVAIESRGFMFGAPLALHLDAAFVPIRKPGKLPRSSRRVTYSLEYGTDALEMHSDALVGKERVLLVDDVLATGGTARAAVELCRQAGANMLGAAFFIELEILRGAAQLSGIRVESVLRY